MTFCPVGDPQHPHIEVNCEPGHPFMVDKKGEFYNSLMNLSMTEMVFIKPDIS